jgi:hypothetical protein
VFARKKDTKYRRKLATYLDLDLLFFFGESNSFLFDFKILLDWNVSLLASGFGREYGFGAKSFSSSRKGSSRLISRALNSFSGSF